MPNFPTKARYSKLSYSVPEKANQLSILSNYRGMVRLVEGRALKEHVFDASPPIGEEDPQIAAYIRQKSAERGSRRDEVEAEIEERIGSRIKFDEIPPSEEC